MWISWQFFVVGLAFYIVLAAAAYIMRSVNMSGAVGGVLVGMVIYCGGPGAVAILITFFVLGSAATKLGYRRKAAKGVAQEDRGRRSARHAFANCGTGALAAVYYLAAMKLGWPHPELALAVLAGAFATALGDTASSEIGQLYGRHPFLITTLKPVPVGTDGAISVEGTVAGIAASAAIALVGWAFGWYSAAGIAWVTAGAFIGTTFESILGAAGSVGKRLNNELLNFLNTVVGGAAAGLLVWLLGAAR